MKISIEYMDELLKNEAFVDVLENTVGFASNLTMILAKRKVINPKAKRYHCSSYSSKWIVDTSTGQQVTYCIGCDSSHSWSLYSVHG